jgi:hypothetical protein
MVHMVDGRWSSMVDGPMNVLKNGPSQNGP